MYVTSRNNSYDKNLLLIQLEITEGICHPHFTPGYSSGINSAQCFSSQLLKLALGLLAPSPLQNMLPNTIEHVFFNTVFPYELPKFTLRKPQKMGVLTCATQKRSDASSVSSAPQLPTAADGEDPLP